MFDVREPTSYITDQTCLDGPLRRSSSEAGKAGILVLISLPLDAGMSAFGKINPSDDAMSPTHIKNLK